MCKKVLSTLTLRITDQEIIDKIEDYKQRNDVSSSSTAIYEMVKDYGYQRKQKEQAWQENQDLREKLQRKTYAIEEFKSALSNILD